MMFRQLNKSAIW